MEKKFFRERMWGNYPYHGGGVGIGGIINICWLWYDLGLHTFHPISRPQICGGVKNGIPFNNPHQEGLADFSAYPLYRVSHTNQIFIGCIINQHKVVCVETIPINNQNQI